MMFGSLLFLFWLLVSSHQLSQHRYIYTEPKSMKSILESSSGKQLDLTECLEGVANGKFVECLAKMVLGDKCDFYLFKNSQRRRRSKMSSRSKTRRQKLPQDLNLEHVRFQRHKKLVIAVHGAPDIHTRAQLLTTKKRIQNGDRATALLSYCANLKFRAKKCPDLPWNGSNPKHCVNGTALMGYPPSKQLTGIHYVKAGKKYPFSLAKSGKQHQQPFVVVDWIKQFTGQSARRLKRNLKSIHNYIMEELGLLQALISNGVQTGLTMSKCSVDTFFGYKAAVECFISHFMVKNCSFFLYTKENPQTSRLLHLPFKRLETQVKKLNIDKHRRVLIVVHGVTSNYEIPWIQRLKYDVLANDNVNVILMDWRSEADRLLMASNVGLIPLANCFAKKLAQFVTGMMRAGWKPSQFHLIGHSLGGQIVGLAGKEFKRLTKLSLPRISALDPAGLAFDMQSTLYRLDKHDAEFVDCIFTTAPIVAMRDPVCTANFYANCYGQDQPGSETTKIGGSTMISHMRAALLFAESAIPSHQFSAKQCSKLPCHDIIPQDCDDLNGTALMGYPASSKMKGIFYVKTRGSYPYALKIKKAE